MAEASGVLISMNVGCSIDPDIYKATLPTIVVNRIAHYAWDSATASSAIAIYRASREYIDDLELRRAIVLFTYRRAGRVLTAFMAKRLRAPWYCRVCHMFIGTGMHRRGHLLTNSISNGIGGLPG